MGMHPGLFIRGVIFTVIPYLTAAYGHVEHDNRAIIFVHSDMNQGYNPYGIVLRRSTHMFVKQMRN